MGCHLCTLLFWIASLEVLSWSLQLLLGVRVWVVLAPRISIFRRDPGACWMR